MPKHRSSLQRCPRESSLAVSSTACNKSSCFQPPSQVDATGNYSKTQTAHVTRPPLGRAPFPFSIGGDGKARRERAPKGCSGAPPLQPPPPPPRHMVIYVSYPFPRHLWRNKENHFLRPPTDVEDNSAHPSPVSLPMDPALPGARQLR